MPSQTDLLAEAARRGLVDPARPEFQELLRRAKEPSGFEYVDNVARRVASGWTFGFADEFAGKMGEMTGVGEAPRGVADVIRDDGRSRYQRNVDWQRERDAAFFDSNPVAATTAEISGAVLSPVNKVLGLAAKALGATGRWGNYGVQGALAGAAAGAGNATEGNRLAEAGVGGLTGAALGVALPGAMTLGTNAVKSMLGRINAPPAPWANRVLRAMSRDGIDVDQARQRLAELGDDSVLADLGGNMRGLAETAAKQPGRALKAAEGLRVRQGGQGDRLMQAALNAAGVDSLETLIKQRSEAARPLYEAAFSVPSGPATTLSKQITSPQIERLITNPIVRSGINKGISIIRNEADAANVPMVLEDYALKLAANGQFERAGTPTLRLLDAAKRGLDDIMQSDAVRDPMTNRLTQYGRSVEQLRSSLVDELDRLTVDPQSGVSLYKQARQAWAGPSDAIEALATIKKTVDRARDFSDITGRLLGSKETREKLSKLMPSQDAFNDFAAAVERERVFAETARQVGGNSRTAFRSAAQSDMAQNGTDTLFQVAEQAQGGALQVLMNIARSGVNAMRRPPTEVADELAGPLFSSDPAMKQRAFDELSRRTRLGSIMNRPGMVAFGRAITPQQDALMTGARIGGYYGGSNQ